MFERLTSVLFFLCFFFLREKKINDSPFLAFFKVDFFFFLFPVPPATYAQSVQVVAKKKKCFASNLFPNTLEGYINIYVIAQRTYVCVCVCFFLFFSCPFYFFFYRKFLLNSLSPSPSPISQPKIKQKWMTKTPPLFFPQTITPDRSSIYSKNSRRFCVWLFFVSC